MFYSISAQRWYRIELKVLIIDFWDKEFYVVLEGRKTMNWVLVTQKEGHYIREYILCKERLDRKSTQDIYPRRVDKSIRVHFEKCLLCTLYQEEYILSSFKVVISQYIFNLTNVGLSMCVMEYSDLFLNLIWTDPDIFVCKIMK